MLRLAAIVVLSLAATLAAHAQGETGRLVEECDRLAASEDDPDKPAGTRGVPDGRIDGNAAAHACIAAIKTAPQHRRLFFQLGRAYAAAGDHQNARRAFQAAENLGSVAARRSLAAVSGPAIRVLTATYGANCGVLTGGPDGRHTSHVARRCDGQSSCQYLVEVSELGDPKPGCEKDYRIEYQCVPGSQKFAGIKAPPEAGYGSPVRLYCP